MQNLLSLPFEIVCAPYGLGSNRKGAAFGPEALINRGLFDRLQKIRPDVTMAPKLAPAYVSKIVSPSRVKYIEEYLAFHKEFAAIVHNTYREGKRPIIVGGDHALSISSIATAAKWLRHSVGIDAKLGLLWVDTHGDINTPESSPTGNIHGMPIRVLLGEGDPALTALCGDKPALTHDSIVYVGIRDLDDAEKAYIKANNIRCYTMRDIDARGIGAVAVEATQYLAHTCTAVVASFDLDACDPNLAPGVGTPVFGGLTEREAHFIMEEIAMIPNLLSIELVEVNPEFDRHQQTVELGIRLLESGLGKRIL